jgi:soluble lytic murein transglycosylase-like protein
MAKKWGLPPDMLARVIDAESSFNPKAKSGVGAGGLMQLMPATAKGLGVSNVYDPEQNVNGGAQYLKGLLDTYKGDWQKALAGYNAGGGRVQKELKAHGSNWFAYMPQETQDYVRKILGGG